MSGSNITTKLGFDQEVRNVFYWRGHSASLTWNSHARNARCTVTYSSQCIPTTP